MTGDAVFFALASPTRRMLLANLAEAGPKTATQLAEEFPMVRQGLLKHLNILRDAELVAVQQQGRDKRYFLTPTPLSDVNRWTDAILGSWDERLQRLKALVEKQE